MSEQKELVAKIYKVHEKLRRNKRGKDGENWDLVWTAHTQDFETLKEYSIAMVQLARNVWEPKLNSFDKNNVKTQPQTRLECRLEWVHDKCRDFFQGRINVAGAKLCLLDVGSCYNPFQKFGDFYDTTAIDLCPAPGYEEQVYQCDFLSLRISSDMEVEETGQFSAKTLISLPSNYFDIVVFSFFLEYLPDPRMRLESCRKAQRLLKTGGMLFILRPDSGNVTPTGSAKLMKGLKVGMGFLGFKRIYFEKLTHFWAIGFVKLSPEEGQQLVNSGRFVKDVKKVGESFEFDEEALENLFSISQDFKEVDNSDEKMWQKTDVDVEAFEELPLFSEENDSDVE